MHLSGLFIYPVKSLRGCAVPVATVDNLGLVGDRRFLVVNEANRHVTQREFPAMARISTALSATTLTLSAEGAGSVSIPRIQPAGDRVTREVSIWKSEGLVAEDCGDLVAGWLSDFLETKCRLVRVGPQFCRPVLKPAARPGDVTAFADAVPFLAISEASLADLDDRLVAAGEESVPMDRFRPNLVISGAAAFAEDTWPRVRVGELVLRAAGPSARCIMTTTDQQTGERCGREPLHTLATYRRDEKDPTRINFGQNLIHETKSGTVRVGDPVHVLGA
jgi:uncharacterized protein YcbX